MAQIIVIIFTLFIAGCAHHGVVTSSLNYEYMQPSPYPLTSQHQIIHVSIDDATLTRPQPSLKYESLKLRYSNDPARAQVIVYVHIQPSFLVQREPISRQVVEFDQHNKGTIKYVMTNRGFIRTPYSIELVDNLKKALIYHTRAADNYPIDAVPRPDHLQTTQLLQQAFHLNKVPARQALLDAIWENLKGRYLHDIQVHFVAMQFNIVSKHEREPIFEKAFLLLKKNDKVAAQQALAIYNKAYKRYLNKDNDDDKRILEFINEGITVASRIANDPNAPRL